MSISVFRVTYVPYLQEGESAEEKRPTASKVAERAESLMEESTEGVLGSSRAITNSMAEGVPGADRAASCSVRLSFHVNESFLRSRCLKAVAENTYLFTLLELCTSVRFWAKKLSPATTPSSSHGLLQQRRQQHWTTAVRTVHLNTRRRAPKRSWYVAVLSRSLLLAIAVDIYMYFEKNDGVPARSKASQREGTGRSPKSMYKTGPSPSAG